MNSLRELRDAEIPDWAKAQELVDRGFDVATRFDFFAGFSAAELDQPFEEPIFFNVEAIDEVNDHLVDEFGRPAGVQTRGIFDFVGEIFSGNCGGRWDEKSRTINLGTTNGNGFVSVDRNTNLGNGFTASLDSTGSVDGSVQINAVVNYDERSNPCVPGSPGYEWRFNFADIDFVAEIDGGFDITNTLTIEQRERLWEKTIRLLLSLIHI